MEKQITMENNSAPAVIKALKIKEHKIEFDYNTRGLPVARYSRLLSSGKNKGHYKHIDGFYFHSEEKRAAWVAKKIESIKAAISLDESMKASKKEARANMKHGFEVGQIFYDSWGYDQTNIDFYKIIEVKEKSVVIQEIGASTVEGSEYFDSKNVKPNPVAVIGKPMLKIIQVKVYDGKPSYRFGGKYSHTGSLMPYKYGDKGVYKSWGH